MARLDPALGLSAFIVAAGAVMHWQRELVARAHFETHALGDANAAYDAVLDGLRALSLRITSTTQRGSLQFNLATIFVCLILVITTSLIGGDLTDVHMIVADNVWQAVTAVIIMVAALGATVMHNRLSAVLVTGVTGYGVAFIFALHGAPDLALTQLLVETIVVVLFMLVLRRMPPTVTWRQDPKTNRLRAWLSVGVGIAVVVVAIFALNARTAEPISQFMPELAHTIGHGANTVNVLLVDLRAWDTFGEITVLAIAATGVASLIYGTESFARPSRRPTLRTRSSRWLATSRAENERRSLLVTVVTHALFPSMMALSLYFFFAGHNAPGGGFAGGLVAALALTLRYLAGGRRELEATLPVDPGRVLGIGLLIAAAAVLVPLPFGRAPLTTFYGHIEVPWVGHVSLPSALVFDAGVYLVVVGLVLHILHSAGGRLDNDAVPESVPDLAQDALAESTAERTTSTGKEA